MTQTQKRFFYEEGFVKIPGVVPRIMVDRARQAINAEIGKGDPKPFRPTEAPDMLNLFNATPVFSLLESTMGKGSLARPANLSITLNYPQPPSATPQTWSTKMGFGIPGAHLDGLAPTSKIQVRTINCVFAGIVCGT